MKKLISTVLKGLVLGMALSLMTGGALAAEKNSAYSPFTASEADWAMEFPAPTTLKLPSFFQNKMLFQQQKPIGVWGVDVPGTEVSVTLASDKLTRTGTAVAGENSYWRVELDPIEASFTSYTLTVSGSAKKTFKEILIGELFVSAGQSNMYFQVNNIMGSKALVNDNTRPNLRLMIMPVNPAENGAKLARPQFDYRNCRWYDGTSKSGISQASGVSYTYARMLYDTLNRDGAEVPVGMIDTAMGSLLIELYLPRQIIETEADVKTAVARLGFYKKIEAVTNDNYLQMSTFYNTKIAPISGFNIRGMIWYQGESNNTYPEDYTVLLNALQRSVSTAFRAEEGTQIPFIYAHIAPHSTLLNQNTLYYPLGFDRWPRINEAMATAWELNPQYSAQVPIYDIPTISNSNAYASSKVDENLRVSSPTTDHPIHPITKQQVGERMAKVALGMIYGYQHEWRAPTVDTVEQNGNKFTVHFNYVGNGLALTSGTEVYGFEVCGENGLFVPARAVISGKDTVTVWSDFLSAPVGVNYAFSAMNNNANLCNSEGLPAVPFRHHDSLSRVTYAFNKDWAACNSTKIWVDSGYFHAWGSIDGFTFKMTNGAVIPMTFRGSDYLDAWQASPIRGGAGTFGEESGSKTEGSASLRLTYEASADGCVGFGPFLQHVSQENNFFTLQYMAFDLKNEDDRAKNVLVQLQTYDGKTYIAAFRNGEKTAVLPAADGDFYTFVTDLRNLTDENGNVCNKSTELIAILSNVKFLQITLEDTLGGSLLFDNFRFGPNKADTAPEQGKAVVPDADDEQVTLPVEKPSFPWPWVAAGAVAVAGAAAWLLTRKKGKK